MNLSSPTPSFLVIVHDGSTIRTADVVFGDVSLTHYKEAIGEHFKYWIRPLSDVVRECGAFEPMKEALSNMVSEFSNQKFNVRKDFSKILYLEASRKALCLPNP